MVRQLQKNLDGILCEIETDTQKPDDLKNYSLQKRSLQDFSELYTALFVSPMFLLSMYTVSELLKYISE